jgi:hypothetical protein
MLQFVDHKTVIHWTGRLRAAGIHLGISLAVALAAALLVFGLWYPYPYREISGGRELFLIVVAVDVVLGPLITLAVFNPRKSRRELATDLSLVALMQLAALGYGLWTVAMARPVHLVFEIDRFRVVHRIEVAEELLPKMPAAVNALPLGGPTLLAVRAFKDSKEQFDATMLALQGVSLSSRPDLWEDYAIARPKVLQAAKPVAQLKARFPAQATEIDAALAGARLRPEAALYLPMVGRKTFWTALLHPATAEVVAFLPLDSF